MKLPELKSTTKADLEAAMLDRRKKEVRRDLQKIDNVGNKKADILFLHKYLDGKYQCCIANWGMSMYGYIDGQGFQYEVLDEESLKENIFMMKAKLDAYLCGWNEVSVKPISPNSRDVNVTVNNTLNVNVTFEQVRSQIEDMSSLTDEQTHEILNKITEIENALSDNCSKKSKWEKVKPILVWLADKSFDVGMALLPLILKLKD